MIVIICFSFYLIKMTLIVIYHASVYSCYIMRWIKSVELY